ncbi:MAG: hypothetical protein ABUL62_34230 [Myxococcales bacterium]
MTADYWLERWREGRTGFHLADVNPRLTEHSAVFSEATRVLVPLCGKSADLEWLVTHGYEVVGVELVELAAQAFFAERGFTPQRREDGEFVVTSTAISLSGSVIFLQRRARSWECSTRPTIARR